MAGLRDASLKAFWNLVVSSVKMNAMKMKFLTKFEVVVYYDLIMPFLVDFLYQLLTLLYI